MASPRLHSNAESPLVPFAGTRSGRAAGPLHDAPYTMRSVNSSIEVSSLAFSAAFSPRDKTTNRSAIG